MMHLFSFSRSIKHLCAVVLCTCAVATVWAQTNAPAIKGDFIVAVVGSQPITNHEVRTAALQLQSDALMREGKKVALQSLLTPALEKLINEKSLLEFAIENKIEVDKSDVDLAEQRLAAQEQITVEQLRHRKLAQGYTLDTFRQELKNSLMVQKLTERSVVSRIKVTDQEVQTILQMHQAQSKSLNIEVEIGQIFLPVPESATPEQVQVIQKRGQTLLDQLKRGADFATLARQNSESPDRQNGGSMGLRSLERYPDLFVENTRSLEVGGLSSLVRSGAGFHILKLLDKRSSNLIPITETHPRHILLKLSSNVNVITAKAILADYRQQILDGKVSFAELAKQHSQDGSAAQGGDLGWIGPGAFVPEFEEVMDKLEINELSNPVVSRFGVHLIQVLERRENTISERELREIIRNQLRGQKYDETYNDWVREIRGQLYVEYTETPR